ncbi:MAG: hypothetical protein Q6367_013890, partial [Candidatus Freyarchaeota archaeon]
THILSLGTFNNSGTRVNIFSTSITGISSASSQTDFPSCQKGGNSKAIIFTYFSVYHLSYLPFSNFFTAKHSPALLL